MTDDKFGVREMSESDLHVFISGRNPDTPQNIAGQQELKRRLQTPAFWISVGALVIAGVSLLVSILVAIYK